MAPDSVGQRSETVRRANLSAIVRELHLEGSSSRSDLVVRTGLTRSAIRELTGELVSAGLARETRASSLGSPGRPSPIVAPEPLGLTVLGLEIAVDSVAAAVIGFGGTILQLARVDRPRGTFSLDATVRALTDLGGPMIERAVDPSTIAGIGVAVVGVVRRADGTVAAAPNLGWRDVPLAARIRDALGIEVPVVVGNEADLGALAELRRGAARGVDDLIFVSGEVGVGGGVITGGRPMGGAAGYAGEIGHLVVNPSGATCRCGSVGCWETEIGEEALLARAGLPQDGGRVAVDRLLADAAAESPRALAALDAVGGWLGSGLAGLVNVFDPRLIVLGGLFGRILPFVETTLAQRLARQALAAPRSLVRVVPSALGGDAALIGAAEAAFDRFLADPAARVGPRASPSRGGNRVPLGGDSVAGATAVRPPARAGAVQAPYQRGTMRRDNPECRNSPRGSRRAASKIAPRGGGV